MFFEASKLVSTKTLVAKHYYRRQGLKTALVERVASIIADPPQRELKCLRITSLSIPRSADRFTISLQLYVFLNHETIWPNSSRHIQIHLKHMHHIIKWLEIAHISRVVDRWAAGSPPTFTSSTSAQVTTTITHHKGTVILLPQNSLSNERPLKISTSSTFLEIQSL